MPLGPWMGGKEARDSIWKLPAPGKRCFSMGCKLWIKNNKNAKEKLTTDFIHLALE